LEPQFCHVLVARSRLSRFIIISRGFDLTLQTADLYSGYIMHDVNMGMRVQYIEERCSGIPGGKNKQQQQE